MTVRDTSAIAHAAHPRTKMKQDVLDYVKKYGPCSRKEIAVGIGADTSSVSGIVTPFVNKHKLDEVGKWPCRLTGNKVIHLESPVQQLRLI